MSERIPHDSAALFGRLRILIGDERLPYDLAFAIKAEPDRNLPRRSVSRRDPARTQRGANVTRVGNRILRRRAMPCGIECGARTPDGSREAH
jgi:hypothetical protein